MGYVKMGQKVVNCTGKFANAIIYSIIHASCENQF